MATRNKERWVLLLSTSFHYIIFILEKLNVRETSLCSAPPAVRIHGSKMALSGVAVIYIS